MNEERILFRVSEVAELIGCSRAHAYELVKQGVIPSIRLGSLIRVPAAALNAMVEQATARGPHTDKAAK